MPKMKSPIERITIETTTLEAILKGEGSPAGCSAVLELLHKALDTGSPRVVVWDKRTGRQYSLTKKGLVEWRPKQGCADSAHEL